MPNLGMPCWTIKVDLHSIRFSFDFVHFFFSIKKYVFFSSTFANALIRTNQTTTCWTKVFRKKNFFKGVQHYFEITLLSFIYKFFIDIQYVTVYFVRVWTYKVADKKKHTFSRRSKKRKKITDKNGRKTDTV